MTTKVAFVGSRDFKDSDIILRAMERMVDRFESDIVIVSGGARGADLFSQIHADSLQIGHQTFYADWESHGRRAGALRNQQIVDASSVLLAFTCGTSITRGTSITVEMARKKGIETHVYFEGSKLWESFPPSWIAHTN
jgi:hypothetical protein